MKSLIAIFVLLFNVSANAELVASYEFGRLLDDDKTQVVVADLDSNGTLAVSVQELDKFGTKIGLAEQVGLKKLHTDNFNSFFWSVKNLSNVEVKEQSFAAVCEIYVAPYAFYDNLTVARGYDWGSNVFLQDSKMILGPQGCWVGYRVSPAVERDYHTALNLKSVLKVLALEML